MSDPAPDPLAAFVRPLVWMQERPTLFVARSEGKAIATVRIKATGREWRWVFAGEIGTAPTAEAARAAAEAEHARMALQEAGRWLDLEAVRAALTAPAPSPDRAATETA